jgi:uncharacterized protein (DUF736 family)
MAFNNDNQGALFVNDKGDNPKRPDSRGRCVIDGKAYRISGWKRKAKSGSNYVSLAFTRSEEDDPTTDQQATGESAAVLTDVVTENQNEESAVF